MSKQRRSNEYLAIKNFLHNTCGLTTAEIKAIAIQAVKDEATAQAKRYLQQNSTIILDTPIAGVIKEELQRYNSTLKTDIISKAGAIIAGQLAVTLKPK